MKKNDLNVMLATSAVCLLPIVLSIILYGSLPEQIAVHWDYAGTPDNFLHKAFAAFGLPVLIVLLNLVVQFRLNSDPRRTNIPGAVRLIVRWLLPVMSLVIMPTTLFIAMGTDVPIITICNVLVGAVLIIKGNYMPKARQNYSVGIRVSWTLNDADNWNKTNRLAGYVFILGGILLVIISFFGHERMYATLIITMAVVVMLVGIPIVYSYLLFKRRGKNEE